MPSVLVDDRSLKRKIMTVTNENGIDELLLLHNPKGGRPMQIGRRIFGKRETDVEISCVREESRTVYHLGNCQCGRSIVVGHKRAEILLDCLERGGVHPKKHPVSFRLFLAKLILPNEAVDRLVEIA